MKGVSKTRLGSTEVLMLYFLLLLCLKIPKIKSVFKKCIFKKESKEGRRGKKERIRKKEKEDCIIFYLLCLCGETLLTLVLF